MAGGDPDACSVGGLVELISCATEAAAATAGSGGDKLRITLNGLSRGSFQLTARGGRQDGAEAQTQLLFVTPADGFRRSDAHLLPCSIAHLRTCSLTQYSPFFRRAAHVGKWAPGHIPCDVWSRAALRALGLPARISVYLHFTISLPRRGELVEELRALERALDFELCVDGERRRPA